MANILSKIGTAVRGAFNTLNAEPAPLPGTPLPAGAAEINQSARGQVIAANGASTDAWTKKFASKPYFDGGITTAILNEIKRRGGHTCGMIRGKQNGHWKLSIQWPEPMLALESSTVHVHWQAQPLDVATGDPAGFRGGH